ncbi:predicted protein [Postia placenta Mad-698-R]|uniref:MARVEL domain-containing protein n=1 Tax=Postia placenta MAD-698-R-SB12 TaxID=670580 RepID=A0A1X6N0D8_9APHY|nr:hypothetical protein POSPLADRAFT_1046536 [Postia placenta MAD-698-R-SB12]EED80411.1 predicted protein [Postia placenta Mad-698-R]OSX62089.1 hypothetical protein POSPLADRAFT_1046536 [Postia placenta MAD-698-R-SB12]
MSRHFRVYIPIRLGLLVLPLCSLALLSFLAYVFWATVQGFPDSTYTHTTKIAISASAVLVTTLAPFSLIAILAAATRSLHITRTYWYMSWPLALFALATTPVVINIAWDEQTCPLMETGGGVRPDCALLRDTLRGAPSVIVTALMGTALVLQVYMIVLSRRYIEQLEESREGRRGQYMRVSTEVGKDLFDAHEPYPYAEPYSAFRHSDDTA